MFENIKKYFENIKQIEAIKVQEYARGQDDATSRFLAQQKSMTKKIEELTKQNNETELRVRTSADERIKRLEKLHDDKCNSCRQTLEEERQRLVKRQNLLSKKISNFEDVWMNMYQHANMIIDEHNVLLRSSGRLVASRDVLSGFKRRVDDIMQESAPLLSIELQDSSEDKGVDLPKEAIPQLHEKSQK